MSNSETPRIVGEVIGGLGQTGVMLWAAIETEGALRIACWIVVSVLLLGYAFAASTSKRATRTPDARPLYGDVHIHGGAR